MNSQEGRNETKTQEERESFGRGESFIEDYVGQRGEAKRGDEKR